MRPVPLFNGVYEIDEETLLVVRAPSGDIPGHWKVVTSKTYRYEPGDIIRAERIWPRLRGGCHLTAVSPAHVFTGIGGVEYVGEPVEATVRHKMATMI